MMLKLENFKNYFLYTTELNLFLLQVIFTVQENIYKTVNRYNEILFRIYEFSFVYLCFIETRRAILNAYTFFFRTRPTPPMEPRAIAKAPEGEGCPRCGGFVYAAEQMLARGRVSIFSE